MLQLKSIWVALWLVAFLGLSGVSNGQAVVSPGECNLLVHLQIGLVDEAPAAPASPPAVASGASDPFGEDDNVPPPSPIPFSSSNGAGEAEEPVATSEPYEGYEYRWKNFLVRPGLFKQEGLALLAMGFYLLLTRYGTSINSKKATTWVEGHGKYLKTQFAAIGVGKLESGMWKGGDNAIMQDSSSKYVSWATGRRGCDGLLIEVELKPRDDLLTLAYETLRSVLDFSFEGTKDKVILTFKLKPSALETGFVWGIVNKNNITLTRDERYDLGQRALATKETEATFNNQLMIFSEHGDIVNSFIHPNKAQNVGILEVFSQISLDYFESLIVSDVGPVEPKGEEPVLPRDLRTLTLTLRLPPSSATLDTLPFVQLACNLVDVIDRMRLTPESVKKLKENRAEAEEELQAENKKYAKEEADEKKRADRKNCRFTFSEAEEDRYNAMSPAQQKKFDEKKKAKDMKKAQSKMVKRR
ncbi:DUF1682-domain-containing protein [Atractiella rhizophila]|nr:DUF1682-domain-containing protein [Atractiella rhizophila]